MKSSPVFLLILFFMAHVHLSHGETDASGKKSESVAEIAVIALGPKPQRRYRETNGGGGTVMLLAQPGETPPQRLFYRDSSSRRSTSVWTAFQLAFNNSAAFRPITPKREIALHRKSTESDEYLPYISLPPVAPMSRTIFCLTPKKLGPTPWDDTPRIRALHLESKDLTDKQFILANYSTHAVQHAFETSIEVIKPDEVLTYQRDEIGEIYRLAARYGTEQKIIYNTAVRLNEEGHAQLFVLYDANPATNAGRDVGVFRMMIPARKTESAPAQQPAD